MNNTSLCTFVLSQIDFCGLIFFLALSARFGGDVQLTGMTFTGFGKNFAKSIKQSPDAMIQVSP